jgi:signal transduction histidine kinase
MAASIAHEINNPLEALLNLIYLARESTDDPTQVRSLLESAENEVTRISHIAKQTLGYYREQSGPTRVSVAQLVRDTLQFYEPRLSAAGINIQRHLESEAEVILKRGEIMQVLSNLIANAGNAMPHGGKLTISVCPRTVRKATGQRVEGVVLVVDDTGTGIAKENLPKIFEPFFTTRGSVGTGIGLWVTRQFVEGHGGAIEVWSDTDPNDHGTRMSVFLPFDNPFTRDTQDEPTPAHAPI